MEASPRVGSRRIHVLTLGMAAIYVETALLALSVTRFGFHGRSATAT